MQIRPGRLNGTTGPEVVVCAGEVRSGDRDREGGLPKPGGLEQPQAEGPRGAWSWPSFHVSSGSLGANTGRGAGSAWAGSQVRVPASRDGDPA